MQPTKHFEKKLDNFNLHNYLAFWKCIVGCIFNSVVLIVIITREISCIHISLETFSMQFTCKYIKFENMLGLPTHY
jgi:hypothetical protein